MNFVAFLIVGIFAGWAAGKVTDGHVVSSFGDMIVGVIGAFLGGFVFNAIGVAGYGFWGSAAVATVGSVVVLFITGVFSSGSHGSHTPLSK